MGVADDGLGVDELKQRMSKVVEALEGGAGPVEELVTRAYRDVPAAIHPIAARSLLAHLRKLESDGRARCDDGRWSLEAP